MTKVLPHAVLTALLLEKGMTLSEISIINSSYMLATFIFEIPSGIISDFFSEKRVYILSIISMLSAYLLIPFTNSLYILAFAWFIYGLSNAFMTGSLDTYFLKDMNQNQQDIKVFNVGVNYVLIISSLLGSSIGLILYPLISYKIYFLSILFLPISLFFLKYIPTKKKSILQDKDLYLLQGIIIHVKKMYNLVNNREVIKILFQILVFQIMSVCFYNYWQIIVLNKGHSITFTGALYMVILIVSIVSNIIFSKTNIKSNRQKNIILIVMTSAFYLFLNSSQGVVFLFIFQLFFNIYSYNLTVIMYSLIKDTFLSTFVSTVSVLMSLFSFVYLFLLSLGLKLLNVTSILNVSIFLFLICSLLISPYKKSNQ